MPVPQYSHRNRPVKIDVADLGDGTALVSVLLSRNCSQAAVGRILASLPRHAEEIPNETGLAIIVHLRAAHLRALLDRLAERAAVSFSPPMTWASDLDPPQGVSHAHCPA